MNRGLTPGGAVRLLRMLDEVEARAALIEEWAAADGMGSDPTSLERFQETAETAGRLRRMLEEAAGPLAIRGVA